VNETPAWASRLGVVAIVLGILLAAWHANEWLKLAIVGTPPYTIATMPEPDCEEDELVEEGLSLEECRQLAWAVHDISISSPEWFKAFHISVSAAGTLLALFSIFAGIALVDYRPWSVSLAFLTFGALAVVDAVSFTGVVNSGPLIRQMYLWSILLWFFIHLVLAVSAAAARYGEPPAAKAGAATGRGTV
jgi:heme A synthase